MYFNNNSAAANMESRCPRMLLAFFALPLTMIFLFFIFIQLLTLMKH